jgi:hypothetical protein
MPFHPSAPSTFLVQLIRLIHECLKYTKDPISGIHALRVEV